jgi:hypothetical protein
MKKPYFFIIGAARAGTTTLHKTLDKHPNIFMSKPIKEPMHFCEKKYNPHPETETWNGYKKQFRGASCEDVLGESSTIYLYSSVAARRISDRISNPKIVAQLRNPLSRAKSHYRRRKRLGREQLSFNEAVLAEIRGERQVSGDPNALYVSRSLYARQLEPYYDIFNENNIMVTKFSDFSDEPKKVLNRLCDFLGVKAFDSVRVKVLNKGTKWKFPILYKILTSESRIKKLMVSCLPKNFRKYIADKIRVDWNISEKKVDVCVSDEVRERFDSLIEQEVRQLHALTGVDFSNWLS